MQIAELMKIKRNRILLIGGAIIALLVAIGGYRFWHTSTTENNKNIITSVQVVTVAKKDLIKKISLVGQTVPKTQVDISAKYAGKVMAVNAALGDPVSAGQILIEEDTKDADFAVAQNRHAYQQASADVQTTQAQLMANYDKARADYDKALGTYQRSRQVYDVGGITQEALEIAQQQMEDSKAALSALEEQMNEGVASSVISAQENAAKAQSALGAAQKQKNDMLLVSSISGVVGYRQVEAGDMVSAGQKLLSIYDNSLLYVDYQVSEQDLPAFSINMPIAVNIGSITKTFQGKVIYISPAIDAASLTYTIRAAIDNPDNALRSGMFAKALLKSTLRPQTLLVPKKAVVLKNNKNYIFVVNEDNVVIQREVTVGGNG